MSWKQSRNSRHKVGKFRVSTKIHLWPEKFCTRSFAMTQGSQARTDREPRHWNRWRCLSETSAQELHPFPVQRKWKWYFPISTYIIQIVAIWQLPFCINSDWQHRLIMSQYYSKHFTSNSPGNLHNNAVRQVVLLLPCYKRGKQSSVVLSYLLKVTKLERGEHGIWLWLSNPHSYVMCCLALNVFSLWFPWLVFLCSVHQFFLLLQK